MRTAGARAAGPGASGTTGTITGGAAATGALLAVASVTGEGGAADAGGAMTSSAGREAAQSCSRRWMPPVGPGDRK